MWIDRLKNCIQAKAEQYLNLNRCECHWVIKRDYKNWGHAVVQWVWYTKESSIRNDHNR